MLIRIRSSFFQQLPRSHLLFSVLMVFGFFSKAVSKNGSAATTAATSNMAVAAAFSTSSSGPTSANGVETRLRNALWGFFAGDALAMPTHWYYGGFPQIQRDYGRKGIVGYMKPPMQLAGSILNKSNINGGGRGSFSKTKKEGISIIGDVINHGKRDYWDPSKQIHYHATLAKGENTLEVQLARVLMKSIVATGGTFDADHFRQAYIAFMTTAGSHNDTYASTCHRMFFANLILKKLPPTQCPDNDHHNVDTIDGLVLPTITALAMAAATADDTEIANAAAATAAVTRSSAELEGTSRVWGLLVAKTLQTGTAVDALSETAQSLGMSSLPSPKRSDQMTACYLSSSLPSTLDMVAKYASSSGGVWEGLLANANVGGENVHRGSILGAVLGASSNSETPPVDTEGLHDYVALQQEIDAFVNVVLKKSNKVDEPQTSSVK